ncbi:MAG: UPF0175 family protein [Deferrisomatales bacterium]
MENQIRFTCPPEILLALHTNSEGFAAWIKEHGAITLFKEGKISSGLAAEWLGLPRVLFLLKAMEAGGELLDDSDDDARREASLV